MNPPDVNNEDSAVVAAKLGTGVVRDNRPEAERTDWPIPAIPALPLPSVLVGRTHPRTSKAFVLWEMMLALMIFSVVAVSLATALHQTIDSTIFLKDESQVRHDLENILAESSVAKLKPGKDDLQVGDGRIQYEREVTRIQPKTERGELLSNLLQVTVRATWQAQGQARSSQAQVVVYQP
jgi:hypothetical protein